MKAVERWLGVRGLHEPVEGRTPLTAEVFHLLADAAFDEIAHVDALG
jgi:hypothetical protein